MLDRLTSIHLTMFQYEANSHAKKQILLGAKIECYIHTFTRTLITKATLIRPACRKLTPGIDTCSLWVKDLLVIGQESHTISTTSYDAEADFWA